MRVTDQILNVTARKAKLPVSYMSLQGWDSSSENSLLKAISKNNDKSQIHKNSYSKLEKTAEQLSQSVNIFMAEGSESMFAKAKESGSKEEIFEHVEKLVEHYNNTMKSLQSTGSPLDVYYHQALQETATNNSEALKNAGLTISKNGVISIDKDTLQASDLDSLETLFGASGTFSKKVSFLSERIADNAAANARSVSSQYNAMGNAYSAFFNKYDFWG